MAVAADKNRENDVKEKDDIGKNVIAKQVEAWQREYKEFSKRKKDAEEMLERFHLLWGIDKKIYEMRLEEGAHVKKPEHRHYVYEDNPKFWDIVREKLEIEFDAECQKAEHTIKQYEKQIEEAQKQIESAAEKLKEHDAIPVLDEGEKDE